MRSRHRWLDRLRSSLPAPLQPRLLQLPPPTPRNLWLCLAGLVALQNCWVLWVSHGSQEAVLALVLWGGALICIEDQLEGLRPQPGWFGLLFGTLLLLWVMARTAVLLGLDTAIYPLAPLAGLALVLLCRPLVRLWGWRNPLACLLLLPVSKLLAVWVIPEQLLSLTTAAGAGFWLSILGLDVAVDGRRVMLPAQGVVVLGPCNGIEIITLLVCVAIIFLLAFPLRSWRSRTLLILLAPLLGLISNTTRIALLATLSGGTKQSGHVWFAFFHDQQGSLLFSALAVGAFGWIYLRLLERELPPPTTDRMPTRRV